MRKYGIILLLIIGIHFVLIYGLYWLAIIFACLIVVLGIVLVYENRKKVKQRAELHSQQITTQESWLTRSGINKDVDYEYGLNFAAPIIYARYVVDTHKRSIYLSTDRKSFVELPFSQINGVEIMEDSDTVGGIGRAVAGGILAGGIGAVVGAITAKKHIMSFKLVIYSKDIRNPHITLTLLDGKTINGGGEHQLASEFANNVNASIKAILTNQTEGGVV